MATSTTPDAATPVPLRRELSEHTAYELTVVDATGATLHLFERGHDAAVFLAPIRIVELRADMAMAMLQIEPPAFVGVRTPVGLAAAEAFRAAFAALDKVPGGEADEVCRVVIEHVRSARPWVLRAVTQ